MVESVAVLGGPGSDWLRVDSALTLPSELYGGDDDDELIGGSGSNTLYGGAGSDTLYLGAGDNIA